MNEGESLLYTTGAGDARLEVRMGGNLDGEGELRPDATVAHFATVQQEGGLWIKAYRKDPDL